MVCMVKKIVSIIKKKKTFYSFLLFICLFTFIKVFQNNIFPQWLQLINSNSVYIIVLLLK